MDTTKLAKANDLDSQIKDYTEALDCLTDGNEGALNLTISYRPSLQIGARAPHRIPESITGLALSTLKAELIKARDIAVLEFNAL